MYVITVMLHHVSITLAPCLLSICPHHGPIMNCLALEENQEIHTLDFNSKNSSHIYIYHLVMTNIAMENP
jgi:hypothetical protein